MLICSDMRAEVIDLAWDSGWKDKDQPMSWSFHLFLHFYAHK